MLDFFRRKEKPSGLPRLHIIEPKAPMVNIKRNTGEKFRPGMWVMLSDRIGILKSMNEFGVCAVMLTDENGMNVVEVHAPVAELRQAKRSELPASRVAHISPEQLNSMGYAD